MAEKSKPDNPAKDGELGPAGQTAPVPGAAVKAEGKPQTPAGESKGPAAPARKTPDTGQPDKPRRTGRVPMLVAVVALIVALAALGGGGWLYQQHELLSARVGEVGREAQARYEELGSHAAIKSLDERTRLLAERVAARFAKVDESLQRTDEALRNAAQEQIRDQRGWRLAEVDYVLRIAVHRLLLLEDIDGAIAALQTADQQLHRLGSPVFIPLRERLNADVRALRKVERPDLPGIAIKLDGLRDVVYELPPRTVAMALQTASAEAEAPLDGLWKLFKHLPVVIKRNQEPLRAPPVRYAPESHARTLEATLGAAQTAALRADKAEYTRLMGVAAQTLREHFEPQSQRVGDTLQEIETLAGASLSAKLPDITGAFALLDELRTRAEGGSAGKTEEAAQ